MKDLSNYRHLDKLNELFDKEETYDHDLYQIYMNIQEHQGKLDNWKFCERLSSELEELHSALVAQNLVKNYKLNAGSYLKGELNGTNVIRRD